MNSMNNKRSTTPSWAELDEIGLEFDAGWGVDEALRLQLVPTAEALSAVDAQSVWDGMDANVDPQTESMWSTLGYDLELEIFSYLSLSDRAVASRVCKSWYRVSSDPTFWRVLRPPPAVRGKSRMPVDVFVRTLIQHGPSIRELRLNMVEPLASRGLYALPLAPETLLPRLRTLVLKRCGSLGGREQVDHLSGLMRQIMALGLIELWAMRNDLLRELAEYASSLQILVIRHCPRVEDDTIAAFAGAGGSSLRHVSLLGCRLLTRKSLDLLLDPDATPSLRSIRVVDCEGLSSSFLLRVFSNSRPNVSVSTTSKYASY